VHYPMDCPAYLHAKIIGSPSAAMRLAASLDQRHVRAITRSAGNA